MADSPENSKEKKSSGIARLIGGVTLVAAGLIVLRKIF